MNIFISNITSIDTQKLFKHKFDLESQDYWAVFTLWSPSAVDGDGKVTKLSQFGSWYPIKKDIAPLTTANNYYFEKLSANTLPKQRSCSANLQIAHNNPGYCRKAQITGKIKKKKHAMALSATLEGVGDIVMIDNYGHPARPKYADDNNCKVAGIGAFPW